MSHSLLVQATEEYELMNYSDHGSVVDGVLYSCDFSDKPFREDSSLKSHHNPAPSPAPPPPLPPVLTLDDLTAQGMGLRAERARSRLEATRKSFEDRERAQKALEGALKMVRPFSREAAAQSDSALGKRTTENSSVVSIPLSKTKKVCTVSVSHPNHEKTPNLKHSLQLGNQNATKPSTVVASSQKNVREPPPTASVKHKSEPSLVATLSQRQFPWVSPTQQKPCLCKRSASSLVGSNGKGWEGTAILYHGSRVRFGCIQFVLSISGRPGHSELLKAIFELRGESTSQTDHSESNVT